MEGIGAAHLAVMQALVLVALAVTALAAVHGARRAWAEDRPLVGGLVAVGAGALALRWAVPGGPFDVNLRTTEVFLGLDPTRWHYGVTFPTTWRALLALVPDSGELSALFVGNAVVGALSCVALGLALREGLGRAASLTAAALLAVWPAHVRLSATDGQPPLEILLTVVAVGAWAWHARRPEGWGWAPAAAATGLAATIRPEGLLLLPLIPLALTGLGVGVPWRSPRTWAALGWVAAFVGLHVAGVLAWNDAGSLRRAGISGWPSPLVIGWRHFAALDPRFSPAPFGLLAAVGVAAGPGPLGRRLAWGALAVLSACFILDPSWSTAGRDAPALLRHQLRSLPWFAVAAALGLQAIRRLGPAPWAVALAVTAGLTAHGLGWTRAPYTVHEEYRFFADHLHRVPEGCAVATWMPPDDRGLAMTFELSRIRGRAHRWVRLDEAGRAPWPDEGCRVWYRPANCATVGNDGRGHAPCEALEATHRLTPLAEAHLPARAWLFERYDQDPVRVGFYLVEGPAGAEQAARGADRP